MADYKLSEKEFKRAWLHISRPRLVRSFVLFTISLVLIIGSLLLRQHSAGEVVIYVVAGITAIGLFYILAFWRQIARAYREQPVFQAMLHVDITDEQLAYTWDRGSYILPWTSVRKWDETSDFLFLYETSISARILPKRALSDAETELIRAKIASLPKR